MLISLPFMSNRPDSNDTKANITGDDLSALLTRLKLEAELYVDGEFCGSWAVDTSGSRRIPFHIIGSGDAWLHINGEKQKLQTGDLLIFPRDTQHVLSSSDDIPEPEHINQTPSGNGATTRLICGFFEFKSKASWPLLDALADAILIAHNSPNSSLCNAIVGLLKEELNQQEHGYLLAVNRLAELLFLQVLRHQIRNEVINTGLLAALFDPHLGKALSLMHQQSDKRWTLLQLAEASALSRSSFAKRFHEMTGTPAMAYLTAWRMQNATELLQHTSMSLFGISDACGYESEAAFRKAFKNHTGLTPGQVRKK